MSKYFKDCKGNRYLLQRRKIYDTRLYFLADCFEDLKYNLLPLVNQKSRDLLLQLSDSLYEQVPHLDCDEFTGFYIVEEGYNK